MIRILLSTKLGELRWTQADMAKAAGIQLNTINKLYQFDFYFCKLIQQNVDRIIMLC